jgi:serine/threonine protein kinase
LAERYPAGMPQELVIAIIAALDYAHNQGLLHRDVKPANIMLTHVDDEEGRRILLTDFGIARPVDDVSGLTTTNMTVGTVAYSAPEQLMGEDIDGRADQYSLAATAYHLLTGAPLFRTPTRHRNQPPPQHSTTSAGRHTTRTRRAGPRAGCCFGQGSQRPLRSLQRRRPGACRTDVHCWRAETGCADHTRAYQPISGFYKRIARSNRSETSGGAGPRPPPVGAGRRRDRDCPGRCRRVVVATVGVAPQRIRHAKSDAWAPTWSSSSSPPPTAAAPAPAPR